jgi:cytochrome c553
MYRAHSAGVFLIAILATSASAQVHSGSEIPWFDMKQCAFCKNMAPLESRMAEISCDTHKVDNGMIMVSFVPEDLKDDMEQSHEKMMETAKQLESGKQLAMCGFCHQIGMLMSQGVKMQRLAGDHGEITLFTSEDPEMVKKIHEFADRTIRETKAQLERLQQGS